MLVVIYTDVVWTSEWSHRDDTQTSRTEAFVLNFVVIVTLDDNIVDTRITKTNEDREVVAYWLGVGFRGTRWTTRGNVGCGEEQDRV